MTAFGDSQCIDRPQHGGFQGLDGIELIMSRCRRAGEIVDFIHLKPDRVRDIVPNEFEVPHLEQIDNIALLTGEKIVEADHVVPLLHHPLAERRPQKAGSSGDKNLLVSGHR